MSQRPPKWVTKHVRRCLAYFDLQIRVHVVMTDCIDGDADCAGHIKMQPRYMDALLRLRSDIEPDEHGYRIVTREMCHLMQLHTAQNIDHIIRMLPKKQRGHAYDLWEDGNERDTETLNRAVFRRLLPEGITQ